ncbi:sugar phosphate isomerase/epimerase family protein [Paenibacillus xerothermodurans]|uniref:Sugar phosphate isomerase/epimerase n=1 Tax=Paenibacillus xerothermodurans TaxID=1977292 RepID=A0A2W1NRZ9_PAEXE|nr:sugar phosphate isomerase/epimerase family protein [Paenibacillus xerothermodurans]PZE20536.1 sugar phosphate isomerase/epimerase [Paenibacillus xerothermodurans]
MKIGLSTYSLSRAITTGEMDVLHAVQWVADNGGEHVEISPFGFDLEESPELIQAIVEKAQEVGVDISNYCVSSNFIQPDHSEYEREIERVIKHVDIAKALGVSTMRHDVAFRPVDECAIQQFEADLESLVNACRIIADYAAQHQITTSVENHGFFIQSSGRIQSLIHAVNRTNFKTTLDIGNFMCVDEDPVAAVKKNLPFACVVHLKDFYLRPADRNPGTGWFQTASGNHLRGAIIGHGDIKIPEVLRLIKESGYDGYISVEFEGMEECRLGSKLGMENVKRMLAEA